MWSAGFTGGAGDRAESEYHEHLECFRETCFHGHAEFRERGQNRTRAHYSR